MQLVQENPVKIVVYASDEEISKLRSLLAYKDRTVERQIKTLAKMKHKWGEAYCLERIEKLKPDLNRSMLEFDGNNYWFLSGLQTRVQEAFPGTTFESKVELPEFKLIPWDNKPPYDPMAHQTKGFTALLANPHSHVEMATGVGKSFLAHLLTKAAGIPVIISTPKTNLAKAFYKEAIRYFGKKRVGMFGAGKKEIGKDILICVGKSLSMVKDPEMKKEFLKYKVFISDESHTLPAKEFQYFCCDLLAHCPYRWFLSATQERNDGKDLMLEGIIGKRVYTYTIQQAITDGVLAKLSFLVFDVSSKSTYKSDNVVKMNQTHIYKNYDIAHMVAGLANEAVLGGMPTLILVDEYVQNEILSVLLRVPYKFASGEADGNAICEEFNAGKIKCVVGTSAVTTGTDFKPNRLTISWLGNKAGTKVKQGPIGRSTRIDPPTGKYECKVVAFRITNVPMLKRHGDICMSYFSEVGPVQVVKMAG